MEFSVRSMKLLLKENTSKRVSDGSAEALGENLEDFAEGIASRALEEAKADDRKTVRAEDIRQALLKN
jgi:histone H3/H4